VKNYRDIEWIKWVIPAAVIVTWVTRILIEPIEDIILESALGIGLMALVILTYVLWRRPIRTGCRYFLNLWICMLRMTVGAMYWDAGTE